MVEKDKKDKLNLLLIYILNYIHINTKNLAPAMEKYTKDG